MHYIRLITVVLLAGIFSCCKAQSSAWQPQNANYDFPRTLFTLADTHYISSILPLPEVFPIYFGVYNTALSDIHPNSGRRGRASLAKNSAFVSLVSRKVTEGVLQPMSISERQVFINKSILLLNELNPDVESITFFNPGIYTEWQWRSKELIDYLTAYDLLKGAGVPDSSLIIARQNLILFATNLHTEANRSIMGFSFFTTVKNNHAIMTASALGYAAIVLADASSTIPTQNWIDAALFNITNVMFHDSRRQSLPGEMAGYTEGPYYFRYASLNMLPFFRALSNFVPDTVFSVSAGNSTLQVRHPFYDTRYDSLYAWMHSVVMPNGQMPPIGDTYMNMTMPELMLARDHRWFTSTENLASQLGTTMDMRVHFISAYRQPVNLQPPTEFVSNTSGNIIFRGNNDLYFHVNAPNGEMLLNGGGHNQADATAFMLYYGGEQLALDPGYLSYSRRGEVGQAHHHNMILVNNIGPSIGSAGSAGNAEVTLQSHVSFPKLKSATVSTNYRGANINRQFIMINGEHILISDRVSSSSINNYQWQLHGNGHFDSTITTGKFFPSYENSSAKWQRKNAVLQTVVTSPDADLLLQHKESVHEVGYNNPGIHHAMVAESKDKRNTSFLALLFPYGEGGAGGNFNTKNFNGAAAIASNNFWALQKEDRIMGEYTITSGETIKTDALLLVKTPDGFLLESGKELSMNGIEILSSDVDVSFTAFTNGDILDAYVSNAANFEIYSPDRVSSVKGSNIINWNYSQQTNKLYLQTSGEGYFQVVTSLATGMKPNDQGNSIFNVSFDNRSPVLLFNLQEAASIAYEIISADGKRVSSVANPKKFGSGHHKLTLANYLAPGVYIVKVEAISQNGNYVESLKVLVR